VGAFSTRPWERPSGPAGGCEGNGCRKGLGASGGRASALGLCYWGSAARSSQRPSLWFLNALHPAALAPTLSLVCCVLRMPPVPRWLPPCFHTSVPGSLASQIFQKTLFLPSVIALSPYASHACLLVLRFKHGPSKKTTTKPTRSQPNTTATVSLLLCCVPFSTSSLALPCFPSFLPQFKGLLACKINALGFLKFFQAPSTPEELRKLYQIFLAEGVF